MSTPACPRFGKWIAGCKFEARYDKGEGASALNIEGRGAEGLAKLADAMMPKVYVHDICIRCGRTVNRPTNPGASSE